MEVFYMEKFLFQIPENCNDENLKKFAKAINQLVEQAYNKGYEDGKGEIVNE